MPETTILDAIRFLSIGCLAVILGQLRVYRGERSRVTPALLLTACAMDYVVVDWQPLHFSSLYLLFLAGAFGLPYAFYLFSRSLFDDEFQLRCKALWPGLAVVLLQFLFYFLRRENFVAEGSAADDHPLTGTWTTIDDESGRPTSLVEISLRNGRISGRIRELLQLPWEEDGPICRRCPDELTQGKISVEVRFSPHAGSRAGPVFGVRVL